MSTWQSSMLVFKYVQCDHRDDIISMHHRHTGYKELSWNKKLELNIFIFVISL